MEKNRPLSVRGAVFEGFVVSAKNPKTVKVRRTITTFVGKFERYKKTTSIIKAHNPPEINAQEGDFVRIGETRKISKTKNFVVIKILRKDKK